MTEHWTAFAIGLVIGAVLGWSRAGKGASIPGATGGFNSKIGRFGA